MCQACANIGCSYQGNGAAGGVVASIAFSSAHSSMRTAADAARAHVLSRIIQPNPWSKNERLCHGTAICLLVGHMKQSTSFLFTCQVGNLYQFSHLKNESSFFDFHLSLIVTGANKWRRLKGRNRYSETLRHRFHLLAYFSLAIATDG